MIPNEFIDSVYGVPYKEDGKDLNGWYCWELIRRFYKDCYDITLPDLDSCKNLTYDEGKAVFDSIENSFNEVALGKEILGDILVLRGEPCHVAIVVKAGAMLHVDKKFGTCVETYYSGLWKNKVVGIFRHEIFM